MLLERPAEGGGGGGGDIACCSSVLVGNVTSRPEGLEGRQDRGKVLAADLCSLEVVLRYDGPATLHFRAGFASSVIRIQEKHLHAVAIGV